MSAWSTLALVSFAGLLAFGLTHEVAEQPAPVEAVQPAWIDLGRVLPQFTLESPEYGREPRSYEARLHRTGGGRQDLLTFGTGFRVGPYLRLSIYRPGREQLQNAGFYLDLARAAALAGLAVTRSALPEPLATRFGSFEVADFTLVEGDRPRNCLGFRLNASYPGLLVSGFACPASDPPDRAALACTLERVDLLSAADDPALAAFFAGAELRRSAVCRSTETARVTPRNAALPPKVVSRGRKDGPRVTSDLN